jgi:hypothetical protein
MTHLAERLRHRLRRWWTVDGEIPRLKERNRQLDARRAADLQALVDAYAAADDRAAMRAAHHALLAAATPKENDRGNA